MGLAGRKQKQRITADPRNLSWADDASRFGLSYLSKFGWDASQGLGASGEGMKTHIKVQHKLDMMGIGAQHQLDPNGIAWRQNKDFEALLQRLNESVEQEGTGDQNDLTERGICNQTFVGAQAEEKSGDGDSMTAVKKRKHEDDPDSEASTKKKRRKEKKERHLKDISADPADDHNPVPVSTQSSSGFHSDPISKPRPIAHRARIRAAKRIADKSASAISEILGIAPASSVSTPTATPDSTSPPSATPDPQPSSLSLDNLTTSAKSVADYFKEKLLARSTTTSAPLSTPQSLSGSATPGLGTTKLETGSSQTLPLEEGEPARKGIGSQVSIILPLSPMLGPGSVPNKIRNNVEQDTATEKIRRKAEHKAEKRKRREAEALQSISKSPLDQAEEGHTESVERVSKVKKKKKRQDQNQ